MKIITAKMAKSITNNLEGCAIKNCVRETMDAILQKSLSGHSECNVSMLNKSNDFVNDFKSFFICLGYKVRNVSLETINISW